MFVCSCFTWCCQEEVRLASTLCAICSWPLDRDPIWWMQTGALSGLVLSKKCVMSCQIRLKDFVLFFWVVFVFFFQSKADFSAHHHGSPLNSGLIDLYALHQGHDRSCQGRIKYIPETIRLVGVHRAGPTLAGNSAFMENNCNYQSS